MSREFSKAFYKSKAWERTRIAYNKYKCGICERCGSAGDIVHHKIHITPHNINNPKITLDWTNLELLCQDCHNKEHFKQKRRYSFDKNGNIVPPGS